MLSLTDQVRFLAVPRNESTTTGAVGDERPKVERAMGFPTVELTFY
jgi:hypothetical protein